MRLYAWMAAAHPLSRMTYGGGPPCAGQSADRDRVKGWERSTHEKMGRDVGTLGGDMAARGPADQEGEGVDRPRAAHCGYPGHVLDRIQLRDIGESDDQPPCCPGTTVAASTPPDTAQVRVTERKGYTFLQGRKEVIVTDPAPVVVYQHTFTDAATVRQLQGWLNEPADAHQALPKCAADASNANTMDGAAYTYSITFTAHGAAVERVDVLMRCFGTAIQRGYAPSLALSSEVGVGPNEYRIITLTYMPTDLEPRSATLAHP